MNNPYLYEAEAMAEGYGFVCGIDEAGRGPLAGPVVAAAVILPFGLAIEGLDDSKTLSEKKRDILYDVILENALAYGIAQASVEEIESLNILKATHLAMQRAVAAMERQPDYALIDGNSPPDLAMPCKCIIRGDGKSLSIAAASVLAKVTRDRMMVALDVEYPQYGFAGHKGYGSAKHMEALLAHGACPWHRESFLKKMRKKHDF